MSDMHIQFYPFGDIYIIYIYTYIHTNIHIYIRYSSNTTCCPCVYHTRFFHLLPVPACACARVYARLYRKILYSLLTPRGAYNNKRLIINRSDNAHAEL